MKVLGLDWGTVSPTWIRLPLCQEGIDGFLLPNESIQVGGERLIRHRRVITTT